MKPADNTPERNQLQVSYGMYILAMLIFGTNGVLVSKVSIQSSQIVLLRTLLGGALLTLIVLLRGGFDRQALRRDRLFLLLGGAALGLNWVALFEAFRRLNISLATLVYYAGPMLVMLVSPLIFREKLNGRKLLSICLVAVGLVCISGSIAGSGMNPSGLVTAVVSALFYASLIIFNKKIVHTSGLQTAAVELDVAFAVVLLYSLLTTGLPHPQPTDWPYLACIGLVNTGLAYLLYFAGLQKLPAQSVALFSYVDPVSALILSAVILHESMTPVQLLGAALIIGGAIFGGLKGRHGE